MSTFFLPFLEASGLAAKRMYVSPGVNGKCVFPSLALGVEVGLTDTSETKLLPFFPHVCLYVCIKWGRGMCATVWVWKSEESFVESFLFLLPLHEFGDQTRVVNKHLYPFDHLSRTNVGYKGSTSHVHRVIHKHTEISRY